MIKELWKDVIDYEGLYKVSNIGRVRSVERYVKQHRGQQLKKGKILKLGIDRGGYVTVKLSKDNKGRRPTVHRLVSQAFITNPDNKPEVNHIDGNKSNNHVYNLEWCTRSENMKHCWNIGNGKNQYTQ